MELPSVAGWSTTNIQPSLWLEQWKLRTMENISTKQNSIMISYTLSPSGYRTAFQTAQGRVFQLYLLC